MMGWLGLTYVTLVLSDQELRLIAFATLCRIVTTAVLMWRYSVINAEKEALCKREGIDDSREEEFRELGDQSPLFRCVGFLPCPFTAPLGTSLVCECRRLIVSDRYTI